MDPMKPMEPMKPMAPMKPMEPMAKTEAWWPGELGEPASSGGQNGLRYAYFPEKQRLAVEKDGAITLYDSGEHRISGVSQDGSGDGPVFSGQGGKVVLKDLKKVG